MESLYLITKSFDKAIDNDEYNQEWYRRFRNVILYRLSHLRNKKNFLIPKAIELSIKDIL